MMANHIPSDDDFQSGLSCTICFEMYSSNNTDRHAKALPCLHTFCSRCLIDLATKHDMEKIECPNCRAETLLENKSLDKIPQNFDLQRVADAYTISSPSQKKCGICDDEGDHIYYCRQCSKTLCQNCAGDHNKHVANHEIVTMEDIQNNRVLPSKVYCNNEHHPSTTQSDMYELTLCCRTHGDIPICMYCAAVTHRNCICESINAVANDKRSKLTKIIENIAQNMDQVEQGCTNVSYEIDQTIQQEQLASQNANEVYAILHQMIEENKKQVLSNIQVQSAQKLKNLSLQLHELRSLVGYLESTQNFATSTLSSSSDAQMLINKPLIDGRMIDMEIKQKQCEFIPTITTQLLVQSNPNLLFESLEKCCIVQEIDISPQHCTGNLEETSSFQTSFENMNHVQQPYQNIFFTIILRASDGEPYNSPCAYPGLVSIKASSAYTAAEESTKQEGGGEMVDQIDIEVIGADNTLACLLKTSYHAGPFSLDVKVKGQHISGSPFLIQQTSFPPLENMNSILEFSPEQGPSHNIGNVSVENKCQENTLPFQQGGGGGGGGGQEFNFKFSHVSFDNQVEEYSGKRMVTSTGKEYCMATATPKVQSSNITYIKWKIHNIISNYWMFLGITNNLTIKSSSYKDETCYGWGGSGDVFIGGQNIRGNDNWPRCSPIQCHDEFIMKIDLMNGILSLKHIRLQEIFTIQPIPKMMDYYLHTNLYSNDDCCEICPVSSHDLF